MKRSTAIPKVIKGYCRRRLIGPFLKDNAWWAFPENAAIAIPIPIRIEEKIIEFAGFATGGILISVKLLLTTGIISLPHPVTIEVSLLTFLINLYVEFLRCSHPQRHVKAFKLLTAFGYGLTFAMLFIAFVGITLPGVFIGSFAAYTAIALIHRYKRTSVASSSATEA